MRKIIIAGNWKMYKSISEAIELVNNLKRDLYKNEDVDIVVCPPFCALSEIYELVSESNIQLGAQNCYWQDEGAFTGEVSVKMLKDAGCKYIIIGHSERRQFFNETNEAVNKKISAVLKHNLTPIVCVGETLAQREANKTFDILTEQVQNGLANISKEDMQKIIIAYEPVWAIGTGKTATPGQAQEVHKFIRQLLEKSFGKETADIVRIQYGGSVKPENTAELMQQPDIDGALVGGASLQAASFEAIVKTSSQVRK